jgi:hypothetical protein
MAEFTESKGLQQEPKSGYSTNAVNDFAQIVTPRYKIFGAATQAIKSNLYNAEEFGEDAPSKKSYLGTAVYTNFIVEAGSYTDLDGELIDYPGVEIQAVLITVSQSKNIVKTAIQGLNGTVKEYISDGDYIININGTIISQSAPNNNNYPRDEVFDINSIFEVPAALSIKSEFLELFDIHSVVVTDYNIGQSEGVRGQQKFNVSLLSDTPAELEEVVISVPSFI